MADSNGHLSFAVVNPSALTSPIHTSYASPVCGSSEQDRSQNAEKVSRFSYAGIKSTCMKKYDVAVVVVVIVVVWVLLALPTIFYSLPNDSNSQTATDGDITGACSQENYTGVICREALLARQSCLPDRNTTDIFIATDPNASQLSKERQAALLIGSLPLLNPSPECMEAAIPFLCFDIFPLCDSNDRIYQPSSAQCNNIVSGVCMREFEAAARVFEENQLPQCQLLPTTTLECNASDLMTMEEVTNNSTDIFNSSDGNATQNSRICNQDFYVSESTGRCTPECGVWEEFPHSTVVGIRVTAIVSEAIYLLSGIAIVVLSLVNYKRIISFPSIFILYNVIALGVAELFLLVGFAGPPSLFCNSRSLFESLMDKTQFCTVQGLSFFYALLVLELLWLFHIMIIFWRLKFPHHARQIRTRGHLKYVHIGMVFAAITLPWVCLGTILGTGGLTMTRFPPGYCLAQDFNAAFYTFVLPISIINALGASLITLILWTIITTRMTFKELQRKNLANESYNEYSGTRTAILKLLIVLFYFFITSVFSLTTYTVVSIQAEDFRQRLMTYFVCESPGVRPSVVCDKEFGRTLGQALQVTVLFLLGFYPLVNLVYIINVENTKKKLSKWFSATTVFSS